MVDLSIVFCMFTRGYIYTSSHGLVGNFHIIGTIEMGLSWDTMHFNGNINGNSHWLGVKPPTSFTFRGGPGKMSRFGAFPDNIDVAVSSATTRRLTGEAEG